jgi:hypothetical protein
MSDTPRYQHQVEKRTVQDRCGWQTEDQSLLLRDGQRIAERDLLCDIANMLDNMTRPRRPDPEELPDTLKWMREEAESICKRTRAIRIDYNLTCVSPPDWQIRPGFKCIDEDLAELGGRACNILGYLERFQERGLLQPAEQSTKGESSG